ncbi:hypothetical protein PSAB6_100016 [Paraburkholderia sabiae]|nr:hypothetical protein PSAB6_100016 [Paraburkholderia sabiae]
MGTWPLLQTEWQGSERFGPTVTDGKTEMACIGMRHRLYKDVRTSTPEVMQILGPPGIYTGADIG